MATRKRKTATRGKLTAKQLDELSVITPEDIERSKVAFEEDAPAEFRELLNSEPDEEE